MFSKKKPMEICPVCGSSNWKAAQSYGILPMDKACSDCGYTGTFLVVDAEVARETQAEISKAYRAGKG